MRMTKLAAVVSSVLLGAGMAHAGDTAISQDKFKAADADGDGSISVSEAKASLPTLSANFTAVDVNGDGKVSADELSTYNKSMEADQAQTPPSK